MAIIRSCAYCKIDFSTKPSLAHVKFCSRSCMAATTVNVKCHICGNSFDAKASAARYVKYCSDECRVRSGPVSIVCEICKKPFFVRSNRAKSARFCSQKCAFSLMRKIVICDKCGDEFEITQSSEQKFCSLKCATYSLHRQVIKICAWCAKSFNVKISHVNRIHCSKFCANNACSKLRNFPEPPCVLGARWIQLGDGKFTLVDEDMFESLSVTKWSEFKGYARGFHLVDGKKKLVSLHRIILNAPPRVDADHANLNKLDNRRSNLRIATKAQNASNVKLKKIPKSGYRGVGISTIGKFTAHIRENGKFIHLGTFPTAVHAAHIYDDAARKHFGSFARLNFPKSDEQRA